MSWDQIENNWVAMTRRMRPSTTSDDAAPAALASGTAFPAHQLARTAAAELTPIAREVA